MALTITEKVRIPLSDGNLLYIATVKGDGSTTAITLASLGMTRAHIAFLAANDEATMTFLTAAGASGTTLTKTDAYENGKTSTLVVIGW